MRRLYVSVVMQWFRAVDRCTGLSGESEIELYHWSSKSFGCLNRRSEPPMRIGA